MNPFELTKDPDGGGTTVRVKHGFVVLTCEEEKQITERITEILTENANLREQIYWLKHGDVLHVLTDQELADQQKHEREVQASITALESENAKLRELVRDMWRFTGTACKKYPRLFDPSAQGGQMVQLNMIDAFEQRMNELELGVDK